MEQSKKITSLYRKTPGIFLEGDDRPTFVDFRLAAALGWLRGSDRSIYDRLIASDDTNTYIELWNACTKWLPPDATIAD